MTVTQTCPTCGPIYACERCGDYIIPAANRVEAKVVGGNEIARSPLVWGVWCSVDCLIRAIGDARNTEKRPS